MSQVIVGQVVGSGIDCAARGRSSPNRDGLGLPVAGQCDSTRLSDQGQLGDGAFRGHVGDVLRHILAIHSYRGAFAGVAVLEDQRQPSAGVGRNGLFCLLCVHNGTLRGAAVPAGAAAAAGGVAAGRTAAGPAGGIAAVRGAVGVIGLAVDGELGRAVGVGQLDAALGGTLGELHAVGAAADDQAAGDGDVFETGGGDAVCEDEVALHGDVLQGVVAAEDQVALHGLVLQVLVAVGGHEGIHDLGKLGAGDVALGVQSAVCARHIALLHQGSHGTLGPGRDLSAVRKLVQGGRLAIGQAKGAGQHGEGLLAGDGVVGAELAVRTLEDAHLHALGHLVVMPDAGDHVGEAGQGRLGAAGKGAVDHGGHLGAGEQALGQDLAVGPVEQAVLDGVRHGRCRPVRGEVGKIRRDGGEGIG